jgi:hypothetical protein
MLQESMSASGRRNNTVNINSDFLVVGGGLAGICTAITAARENIIVVLVQDRSVLGGNASSEVRLWALGATSHMGNNNRWAREGGVIDEILVENLKRNPEGNSLIFDTILLEKVILEDNITLLLNTAVHSVFKNGDRQISQVEAFCSQNSTTYNLQAKQYCDASGDGVVGFLAGAEFRMGAESIDEFNEKLAPEKPSNQLLGHTIYFHSKRVGKPVSYTAPSFAIKNITEIPRYKTFNEKEDGCFLWWIEYGGLKDTVHDSEEIKWELWKIVYGVWDHIKNSGEFDNVDDLTLEWVGTIPGKRESRRFEGRYMLCQQDIVEQRHFDDAVAHGGWAIDLHPSEGVYSAENPCSQWHSKGVFQIPYRCFISKDIDNLFFAGRIISATHLAFGSTRVMLTCALGGQAVGMAAALCVKNGISPCEVLNEKMPHLQQHLNLTGQSIPSVPTNLAGTLLAEANIDASSQLQLSKIPFDGKWMSLDTSVAQLLPLKKGQKYSFEVQVKAKSKTTISCELRSSVEKHNYTPEITHERVDIELFEGEQNIEVHFGQGTLDDQYGFVTFLSNDDVEIRCSDKLITGIVTVFNKVNKAVSNYGRQIVEKDIGIDDFEFWTPARRPNGHNIAMNITPALECFEVENLSNGFTRPTNTANAWVASFDDPNPAVTLSWDEPKKLKNITLFFDTDYDYALETVHWPHSESVIPFCVRNFRIKSLDGQILHECKGNYQTINSVEFEQQKTLDGIIIELDHPSDDAPTALCQIIIN